MKVIFISFHNWKTKRQGGFHKFAEACADNNCETLFFSFSRPYYSYFLKDERLNKKSFLELTKGKLYKTDKGNAILNFTWPTFKIPNKFSKYIPQIINKWLRQNSLLSFKSIYNKWLKGTDIFIIESCEGIELLPLIKKYNPYSKIVYRPSDPLLFDNNLNLRKAEEYIIKNSDLVLLVNEQAQQLYTKHIDQFNKINYKILPNGVDYEKYGHKYPIPSLMKDQFNVLYVGAFNIEWNLLLEAAQKFSDINFIIIAPISLPQFLNISSQKNIVFIPGIYPNEVPAYVTNCDIFMVPYSKDQYLSTPFRGITAKYYQAMVAKKPIIAYEDNDILKEFGILVTHTYSDFINNLSKLIEEKSEKNYSFQPKNWKEITNDFMNYLSELYL